MKKMSFNKGWRFYREGSDPVIVTLPHDAMLGEKRAEGNPSGAGGAYFAGGSYVYEKAFEVPEKWKEKRIVLQFEGVYQTAVFYLNGQKAGSVANGYRTTEVSADPYLQYGRTNTIRVEVDNQNQPNSRWYSGAGIYRSVWLYVMEQGGISLHGVKIRTLSYEPARIEVTVPTEQGVPVITILDGEKAIAKASGTKAILEIPEAKLWSEESPFLYQGRVELKDGDTVVDTAVESFGIRKLEWSPKGLLVNGKETLLRGGCIHHDNGLLGACAWEEAERRKVRILKEQGFNAIRSSHNPCSEALLTACDALGMYLIDETWDMWYHHKNKYDYASFFRDNYKEDIRAMVEKDFNHPSVIFYSIGNEVTEPASEEGLALEREMVEEFHALDDTRPVTCGMNLMILANAAKGQQMYDGEGGVNSSSGGIDMSKMNSEMFNRMTQQIGPSMNHAADSEEADAAVTPAVDLLDIAGYNYASGRYPLEGEKHPERIIFGSETFPPDIFRNWEMVKKYPWLIGDFMWAAWDYLGEVGIGAWTDSPDAFGYANPYPWLLGATGVVDLLGNPDGQALYAKTVWEKADGPLMAVRPVNMDAGKTLHSAWRGTNAFPSWSWKDCDGKPACVEVYAKGEMAELRINGAVKEKKKLEECRAVFETTYEPGTAEAVVYDAEGIETGRTALVSAAGRTSISVEPEGEAVRGKLLFVNINICGENGIVECNADETLQVAAEGGELLTYGSAAPRTEESYLTGCFTTYYGRSQAVILVGEGENLKITIQSREGTVEKMMETVSNTKE